MNQDDLKQKVVTALDHDRVAVVYQPIFRLNTKDVVSAEALFRYDHPKHGLVGGAELAEAAETGPEIFPLEQRIMDRAFQDAASWQRRVPSIRLNLNLSAREFQGGTLIERFDVAVQRWKIDPHRLNLEITETSYIKSPEEIVPLLNTLKERGVGIWLDDFGTGHSSVSHLRYFPVDGIKIPSMFVCDIQSSERCRILIAGMVRLAHELSLEVVAEGVENEEQEEMLRSVDCDYVQGFLLGKPMSAEDLIAIGGRKARESASRPT